MGIPISISDLVNRRTIESNRVELKSGFNPDAVIRTICAFANDMDNTGGGYIVLGVEDDNGRVRYPIKGLEQDSIDGIMKKLREYCHYIEPLYEPIAEPVFYEGIYLIVIWVPGGYGRPYKAPKEVTKPHSPKSYYIRKFSSSVAASRDEERELFYVSGNIPFDDRPNLAADISDLDIVLLRAHLKETGSSMYEESLSMDRLQLAKSMHLVDGPSEDIRPRNVALLMFSEKIEEFFRYARIEFVDIPDETGNGMLERTFTGPIQRQLKDALAFIHNYVIQEKVIKLEDRAEAKRVFNYPFRAIEEILANAVYHKSYQINEPVTVRVEKDRIEITSHPGFDRSITDEKIARGDLRARTCRNRRIGDLLKELRLIEGRNTGFPMVRKALEENGSDPFIIDMDPERTYVSIIIPIHREFLTEKTNRKRALYEELIEEHLSKRPLTLTELARALGYRSISAKLSRTVKSMADRGKIRRSISDGSVIRYFTAGLGGPGPADPD
jgi:ATP-dependent DNA helicase RecG